MSVRLNGSSSGYTELDAGAVAGNNTIKMPTSNGSANQLLRNGATPGTLEFGGAIVSGTAQNTTSGTAFDFTGIPSWVKRVTVMLTNVSLSGTSDVLIQIGAGSFVSTGYQSGSYATNNTGRTATTGFNVIIGTAALGLYGHLAITNVTGNTWLSSHQGFLAGTTASLAGGGFLALSGTLDRIRITTVNGTDTFDAGTINILYE